MLGLGLTAIWRGFELYECLLVWLNLGCARVTGDPLSVDRMLVVGTPR